MMEKRDLTFGSLEELAAMLEEIGLRLHSKNRIAGGESTYLWLLAETIIKSGRLALVAANGDETRALYGDGYSDGSIPKNEQLSHFMAAFEKQSTDGG